MNRNTVQVLLTVLGAAFFLLFGLWPFLDAQSFFDTVAPFAPYNAHFLHDIGAFQLGIGATLAIALWRRTDAIFAALAGSGIGAAFHVVTHIRDRDLGGSDSNTVVLAILAVLLLAGAAWKMASEQPSTRP